MIVSKPNTIVRTNQYEDFHHFDGVRHQNHFGFSDIESWVTKQAGYITGNPALTAAAQAQQIVNDSGAGLTEPQKQALLESNVATGQTVQGEATVKAVGSIFDGLKWVLYAGIAVIIFVVFVEIKKAVA